MEKYSDDRLIGSKASFELEGEFAVGKIVKISSKNVLTIELDHPIEKRSECSWDRNKIAVRKISIVHVKWKEIESVSGRGENLGEGLGIADSDTSYTIEEEKFKPIDKSALFRSWKQRTPDEDENLFSSI